MLNHVSVYFERLNTQWKQLECTPGPSLFSANAQTLGRGSKKGAKKAKQNICFDALDLLGRVEGAEKRLLCVAFINNCITNSIESRARGSKWKSRHSTLSPSSLLFFRFDCDARRAHKWGRSGERKYRCSRGYQRNGTRTAVQRNLLNLKCERDCMLLCCLIVVLFGEPLNLIESLKDCRGGTSRHRPLRRGERNPLKMKNYYSATLSSAHVH